MSPSLKLWGLQMLAAELRDPLAAEVGSAVPPHERACPVSGSVTSSVLREESVASLLVTSRPDFERA